MSDKTWRERLEDFVEIAVSAMGALSAIAVILTAVWAVIYCWANHITVSDIGQTITSFVDDGRGDEVGFVKAMRAEGYNESANDALDAGHKICSRLRSDGSTPTDVVNWLDSNTAGLNPVIVRKMTFTLVTNAQVYLCPDTLHNTGTPTPTTVTVTSSPAPTTYPTRKYPPTMVATTTAPHQPDWAKYCREHPEDSVECGETGPNPVPSTPGGSLPPTPTAAQERHCGTGIPAGCIDPTPTDIANATQACAGLRANPTDGGVELVTNRLLNPYGRDAATGLMRYATVAICPDMAPAVAREWNNRMARIGDSGDWDSLWKPE